VLGIGNILNRDEGIGVHAVKALEMHSGADFDVEFIDGGVLGLSLLPIVEACSHLIVIDAIDAGRPPGTLIEMSRDEIPLFSGVKMSEHQVTFQEVLGLAVMRECLPETLHLVGAQPVDTSIGLGLTDILETVKPAIIGRVIDRLREWGLAAAHLETADAGSPWVGG
jgi:hydrogenase maturation protease